MPQWTPQQEAAIKARNPRVLVSAAAGSGKTSVLVARVLDMLREGITLTDADPHSQAPRESASRLQDKLGRKRSTTPPSSSSFTWWTGRTSAPCTPFAKSWCSAISTPPAPTPIPGWRMSRWQKGCLMRRLTAA